MRVQKITSKPNFKVKHPYANLIKSMVIGLIIFFSSVLSLGTNFFGLNFMKSTSAISGTGKSSDPFVISSQATFNEFANTTYFGNSSAGRNYYYRISGNFTLTTRYNGNFYGILDGEGRTVTVSAAHNFFTSNYGTIRNIYISSSGTMSTVNGKLVSFNYGLIENIQLNSKVVWLFRETMYMWAVL